MIGSTVSHYEILEKLGEGGMGVVYKAQDTKLSRTVALKFLPEQVSVGSAELDRFIQEAKAAAALNHPNICTIYGIEEADARNFIVMELVDGQMLRDKISSLSMKQALDFGIQIAEGLAAAHAEGIVHRDIKPENIMVRKDGRVQIMDFGLAKLRGASRLTKERSTVGTAGYMSPEQVQGQDTDHRSDIFSLGVLLYEMLTGQPPFKGTHETAIAYEIVNVDSPPMSSIRPDIPPQLDAVVLECLEKDPGERKQSASQVAVDLKRYKRESSRERTSRITAKQPVVRQDSAAGDRTPAAGAHQKVTGAPGLKTIALRSGMTVVLLFVGLAVGYLLRRDPSVGQPLRVTLDEPDGLRFDGSRGGYTVISPDGKNLAFVGIDSSAQSSIYLRALASSAVTKLQGTDGAIYPFWAPDGASLGFFASGKLKRVDISGNPPLTLAEAPAGRGGAWSYKGMIVFSPDVKDGNLYIVSASGGNVRRLTDLDTTGSVAPRFPFFLPDGDHFLFVTLKTDGPPSPDRTDFLSYVGDVDGTVHLLPLKGALNMFYASGHLIYVRQTTLIAQSFDPDSFELTGSPVPLETHVNVWPQRAKGDFSVSQNGLLVVGYQVQEQRGEFLWFDKDGRQTVITAGDIDLSAMISPDGTKFAYDQTVDGNTDIWVYDLVRDVNTRFTFGPEHDHLPVWSPDGKSLYYSHDRSGRFEIFRKPSDGMGQEQLFAPDSLWTSYPSSMSPDGRYLLVTIPTETTSIIGYVQLAEGHKREVLIQSGHRDMIGKFSPDGRWFAYQSNESGRNEVYLRPFLMEGGKMQVSAGGGQSPLWSHSGEIFFVSDAELSVVRADLSGSVPRLSPQKRVFSFRSQAGVTILDVTRDGKKFLARNPAKFGARNGFLLIANWPALVRKD